MDLYLDESKRNTDLTRSVQVMEKTTTNNPTTCKAQSTNFPMQLHTMLHNAEKDGYSHICSWKSHGRAFEIYDRDAFINEVTPLYFSQKRFGSFQRQLNLWGFQQMSRRGSDPGAYYHDQFLKGRPDLCLKIRRVKSIDALSRLTRNEPNFYKMKPVGLDDEPLPSHKPKQSPPSSGCSIAWTAFNKLSKFDNFDDNLKTSTAPKSLLESLHFTPVHALNRHSGLSSSNPSSIDQQPISRLLAIPFQRDSIRGNAHESKFPLFDDINTFACVSVPRPAQRPKTDQIIKNHGDSNNSERITPLYSGSMHGNASNDISDFFWWSKVLATTEKSNEVAQAKRSFGDKILSLSSDTVVKRKPKTTKQQTMKSYDTNASLDGVDDMSESDIASMVEFLLDVEFDG